MVDDDLYIKKDYHKLYSTNEKGDENLHFLLFGVRNDILWC